jgi:hypothetical protein
MRINVASAPARALLDTDRWRIELMNGCFVIPGTLIVYYGDEIDGDNIYLGDRNGVRTSCSGRRVERGFSSADPRAFLRPRSIRSMVFRR